MSTQKRPRPPAYNPISSSKKEFLRNNGKAKNSHHKNSKQGRNKSLNATIKEIVERILNAKANKRGCTLLIGAGCSVQAGIPLALDIVKEIKENFPETYKKARRKDYARLMAELDVGYRRDLIAKYIDSAKINPAHIAIAQLIKHGYVDRVLTTNFDQLTYRACSLVGAEIAEYDLASSPLFRPADIVDPAVFYLHGQRKGFVLLNTKAEFNSHSKVLEPVFEDARRGRLWIVVGYSGLVDPVFTQLAKQTRYDYGLYWVGYMNEEPARHVQDQLLINGKSTYFVKGFDADTFFVELSHMLDCWPPDFIRKPSGDLAEKLEKITLCPVPVDKYAFLPNGDLHKSGLSGIGSHKKITEQERHRMALLACSYLKSKMYKDVVNMLSAYNTDAMPELAAPLAVAYEKQGWELYELARTKTGREAQRFMDAAEKKFLDAEAIFPGAGAHPLICLFNLRGD